MDTVALQKELEQAERTIGIELQRIASLARFTHLSIELVTSRDVPPRGGPGSNREMVTVIDVRLRAEL